MVPVTLNLYCLSFCIVGRLVMFLCSRFPGIFYYFKVNPVLKPEKRNSSEVKF